MPETRIVPKREYQIEQRWKWLAIGASVIAVLAIISKWFEPHPLYVMTAGAVVIAYFVIDYFRKRVVKLDAYKIKKKIIKDHFVGMKEKVKSKNVECVEVAPDHTIMSFKGSTAKTFTFRDGRVTGFQDRKLRKVIQDIGRSRAWEAMLKLGMERELARREAERMGFVIKKEEED